jgi:hypothetical protein
LYREGSAEKKGLNGEIFEKMPVFLHLDFSGTETAKKITPKHWTSSMHQNRPTDREKIPFLMGFQNMVLT